MFGPIAFGVFMMLALLVGFGLGLGWNERVKRILERRIRRLTTSLRLARSERDALTERLAAHIVEGP